jgi:truncated hemoglobin YjbI
MRRRAFWLVFAVVVAGCMEGQKSKPLPRKPSLYTNLGGTAKLEQIVARFVTRVAEDSQLREPVRNAFQWADVTGLEGELVRRLGAVLGGPYPGTLENLRELFTSEVEDLTADDMGALLKLLDAAMADVGCRTSDRQDAMKTLAPLRTLSAPEVSNQ